MTQNLGIKTSNTKAIAADSAKRPLPSVGLAGRVRRWWQSKNRQSRHQFLGRSSLSAACFSAVVFGMPVLSDLGTQRQDEATFRARNIQLAKAWDAGEMVQEAGSTSPLFGHDWLQHIEYSLERDANTALSRYSAMERDRAAISSLLGNHRIDLSRVSQAEDIMQQTKCLALAIYYEAGSERTEGQLAVGEVVMNRVRDHRYPNTVCDVVFQGATRTTGCQFTFTCDGAMKRKPFGRRWQQARTIAEHVMMNLNEIKTGGATHYHAVYVNPIWNSGLIKTKRIGLHIFYRFPRGHEWSVAAARQNHRIMQNRARRTATRNNAAAIAQKPQRVADDKPVVSADNTTGIGTVSAQLLPDNTPPLPGQ